MCPTECLSPVCSSCLQPHRAGWRGNSTSTLPEVQQLRGRFHSQGTKENAKPLSSLWWGELCSSSLPWHRGCALPPARLCWDVGPCATPTCGCPIVGWQGEHRAPWPGFMQLSENQVLLCSWLQDTAGSGDSSTEACVHQAVQRIRSEGALCFLARVVEGIWSCWLPAQHWKYLCFAVAYFAQNTFLCMKKFI